MAAAASVGINPGDLLRLEDRDAAVILKAVATKGLEIAEKRDKRLARLTRNEIAEMIK